MRNTKPEFSEKRMKKVLTIRTLYIIMKNNRNWVVVVKNNMVKLLIFISLLFLGCVSARPKKFYDIGYKNNNNGEYDYAIENFENALKIDSEYADAYSGLAYAYYKKGNFEQAINYCNKSIAIDPEIPRNYLYLGYIFMEQKKYTDAINKLNKYIGIKADDEVAYSNRGIAYVEIGEIDLAIQDFTKAIDLELVLSHNYKNRAIAYFELKEYDKAINDLNKTIELNPKDDNAYALRGMIEYDINKDYTKALTDAKFALEINHNNSIAKNIIDVAEKNGISLTERGTSNISINIEIGSTINEYLQMHPYLTATSINTLIDKRFVDVGDLFYYYFDKNNKKLKAATWIRASQNKNDWFNSWLTQFISDGDEIIDTSEKTKKVYINNTPLGDDNAEVRVTRIIELNNEFAAIYFVIEEK
jgi:tetratricopeptide (TPR) repeat protein